MMTDHESAYNYVYGNETTANATATAAGGASSEEPCFTNSNETVLLVGILFGCFIMGLTVTFLIRPMRCCRRLEIENQRQLEANMQLENENNDKDLRNERIKFYTNFFGPYSKTLDESDFVDVSGDNTDTSTAADSNSSLGESCGSSCTSDNNVDNDDIEANFCDASGESTADADITCKQCTTNVTNTDDDNSLSAVLESRFVRLPVVPNKEEENKQQQQQQQRQHRLVEGACSICLKAYEVGDTIIWSAAAAAAVGVMGGKGDSSCPSSYCPHAYHKLCILNWLGRDKVQCPMCRQLFVPPSVSARMKYQEEQESSVSSTTTASSSSLSSINDNTDDVLDV